MKTAALCLSVGLTLCAASFGGAEDGVSKDEQKLEQVSSNLDKDSERPEGPKTVESRLKSEFKVDDARIKGLRDQKLGYGEISIMLALAEKRPGGITDANIQAIMAERQGPPKMGWGQIAKKQGTTLGKVRGKVRRIERAQKAHDKRNDKAEKADRGEKTDRSGRAERHERHERAEKPGSSKH